MRGCAPVALQTRRVGNGGLYLCYGQMAISEDSNDLEMILESVYSKIHDKLSKELLELSDASNCSSGRSMIC